MKDGAIDAPPDALVCTTPNIKCGDMCVNPTTDNNHCGDCNTVCGNGSSCQTDGSSTICCPTGQHNCGGTCVDETSDESHCGSCTTVCSNTQTCDNGTCCGNGTTVCTTGSGPQCFDLNTDENHCGSCTTMCTSGQTCTTQSNNTNPKCCATGDNNCNNTCSDPKTDNNNCGACGTVCDTAAGQSCSDGKCCGTGTVSCDGVSCVSPGSNTNCGATSSSCGTNCTTQSKVCKTNSTATSEICCTAGQNNCGGACSDPLTDNNNCGSCGNICGTGTSCSNGTCCGPGETGCGGTCVDLNTDPGHCGSCNTTCTGSTPACDGAQCAAACDTTTTPPATDCSGACVFTGTDHDHCGNCTTKCAANQVCASGTCTTVCPGGTANCGGSCVDAQTDPNHCGTCGNVCNPGDECVGGVCQLNCPPGQKLCGGVCVNPLNDDLHCSTDVNSCGAACATGSSCQQGVCCPSGQVNCNGACVSLSSDMTCGSCSNNCTTTSTTCSTDSAASSGQHICCPSGQINCGGTCINPDNSTGNCGGCSTAGGNVCTSGAACDQGECCAPGYKNINNNDVVCCPDPATNPGSTVCNTPNPTCVNTNSDNNHCGSCANACGPGEFCSSGTCTTVCTGTGNNTLCGVCTNPQIDPNHCGAGCLQCASGQCSSGSCVACATVNSQFPDECSSGCTNIQSDPNNCGACNNFCSNGEACVHDPSVTMPGTNGANNGYGTCCPTGQATCGGTCVTFSTGVPQANGTTLDCGSCGNTCAAGSSCTNGVCKCPFGTSACGGSCVPTVADPNNCGACGNICGSGANAGNPVCVSGECIATCPAPLIKCGNQCVNPDDSNANCGGCGNACTGTNTGCSAGACVPVLGPYTTPPKCIGGGPPIIVPTDGTGGGQQCTGNLGAVAFTFGMCSRTNIGSLSQNLITDAFDSSAGAYKATCTTAADCDGKHCSVTHTPCSSSATCTGGATDVCVFPVACVNNKCVGGGVGLNGTVTPVASNSALTSVGGDFWVFGLNGVANAPATGLAQKANTDVYQRFINHGTLDLSKTSRVFGKAYVTGAWSAGGNSDMTITGMLTTTATCTPPPLPSGTLHLNGGCTSTTFPDPAYPFTTAQPPCGALDGSDGSLLKIKELVNYFKDPAHNDNNNVTPNIAYNTFDTGSTTIRLDLPCGYYYFNSLNIGKDTTIVVHGRTAIIVAGAMRVSQKLIFDLDPGATLDIFVGGVVNVSNVVTLGSPAYPRRSRLWIGSASCLGSGTCTNDTQCCSGVCSAGVCTAGGGNLSQAMSLSNGGNFNGLIWAGYGIFTHSNPLEMYGSIYTNHFDASGDTTVHYDIGATGAGEECPQPPPANTACEGCRQCNNQPCLPNGQGQLRCGSPCTLDSQCCAPLHCDVPTGVCKL